MTLWRYTNMFIVIIIVICCVYVVVVHRFLIVHRSPNLYEKFICFRIFIIITMNLAVIFNLPYSCRLIYS